MSREEKEKLLNEKMENIRKRNEELRKRHEEIEADKKNADKFSSSVTMDNNKVKPYVMKSPKPRQEKTERQRESHDPPPIPRPSDIMPTRQRLSENDGPPPDPSYRFLSDPDRDGDRERKRGGRNKKKGRHDEKWGPDSGQEDGRLKDSEGDEMEDHEKDSSDNFGASNEDHSGPMDQRFPSRRGRGRGRGYDKGRYDYDDEQHSEDAARYGDSPEGGDRGGRKKMMSNKSFACRDIRYYPDENDNPRKGKEGRGRGRGRPNFSPRDYGDDGYSGSHRYDKPRGRGRGKKEYERWKAERAAIDEERVMRGRTDGGSWRREWDCNKISQGEDEEYKPSHDAKLRKCKDDPENPSPPIADSSSAA